MPFPNNRPYDTKVVGESHYEDNLRDLCGPATDRMRQFGRTAILTLETSNPYDKNAVCVDIDGLTVGHLSRPDASWFRRISGALGGARFACDAVIIAMHGNAAADYGVRLDVDPTTIRRV